MIKRNMNYAICRLLQLSLSAYLGQHTPETGRGIEADLRFQIRQVVLVFGVLIGALPITPTEFRYDMDLAPYQLNRIPSNVRSTTKYII